MNFSLNKLLSGILIFLTAAIIVLTAAFLIADMRPPRKKAAQPVIQAVPNAQQTNAYSGFGRLRAVTRPAEPAPSATVVFSPWFSYQNGDSAFYEELTKKSGALKKEMIRYFALHTYAELKALGEERVKAELTAAVNEKLVLDKIDSLYFSEYALLGEAE